MNAKIKLTLSGKTQMQAELLELKNTKRPWIVDRLSNARAQGDLSENSDYQSAKEELEFLDGRIEELEGVLRTAVVVSDTGTKITVKVNGKQAVFNIVGEWEADPINKKISDKSPLGQALVGKKVGEEVEVQAPAGKVLYKVIAVE